MAKAVFKFGFRDQVNVPGYSTKGLITGRCEDMDYGRCYHIDFIDTRGRTAKYTAYESELLAVNPPPAEPAPVAPPAKTKKVKNKKRR